MINPASIRAASYIAVVLVIFFAGFKANGYLWSARYDKLEAAHALRIEEQRQRLLTRQELINDETEERELTLLHELEIQKEVYETLKSTINETPLVTERIVRIPVDGECAPAVDIDWSAFGRLYDSAATPRPATEVDETDSGNAGSETSPESG